MATKFQLSQPVKVLVDKLIKANHTELGNLKIVCIFEEKINEKTGQGVPVTKSGRDVFADVKIVSGLNAFLASDELDNEDGSPFFVLVVFKTTFNKMNAAQREALIDQQLCRMDVSSKGNPLKIDYDLKEFNIIAKRHGAWNEDISRFMEATSQMKLPDEGQPSTHAPGASATDDNGTGKEKASKKGAGKPKRAAGSTKKSQLKLAASGGQVQT